MLRSRLGPIIGQKDNLVIGGISGSCRPRLEDGAERAVAAGEITADLGNTHQRARIGLGVLSIGQITP